VADENRMKVHEIAPQVWRVHAHFRFMEQRDPRAVLQRANDRG